MHSHLLLLVLFALGVSTVFSLLMKQDTAEQLRFGSMLFAGFLGAAVVLGWLMFPFPL